MEPISVEKLLADINKPWRSVNVGSVNGNRLRFRSMSNVAAEWHVHSQGDEMFLVFGGVVYIDAEQDSFILTNKEFIVVPTGVRHRARAESCATLLVNDNISN